MFVMFNRNVPIFMVHDKNDEKFEEPSRDGLTKNSSTLDCGKYINSGLCNILFKSDDKGES